MYRTKTIGLATFNFQYSDSIGLNYRSLKNVHFIYIYICHDTVNKTCEDMGLNPAGNVQFFFRLCDETSKYGFCCKYFFTNYRSIGLWTIGTHFLKTFGLLALQISD
jgi:hypothetical protein